MNDRSYEVSLRFIQNRIGAEEALKNVFYQLGFLDDSLTVSSSGPYSFLKVYCPTKREADRLSQRIKNFQLKNVQLKVKQLKTSDWRDKWKDALNPFRLTKTLDVVPLWKADTYLSKSRTPIYLDTTLAFGTGLHETTRFMAQFIEKYKGKFSSFLDIGTGTGILSIIAAKNGAQELWALDIDESSIRTAQQNCACNDVTLDWSRAMDFRQFRRKKKFDFVAANIITDELIAMRDKIVAAVKPEKYLALSGISLENLNRFKKAFQDQPLRCLRVLKGRKWAAVLYKKVMSDEQ